MDRFSFTLQVGGLDPTQDDYETRLFEAGCSDALVAVVENAIFVDFDREAPSFEAAMSSATRNVERAGGHVIETLRLTGI